MVSEVLNTTPTVLFVFLLNSGAPCCYVLEDYACVGGDTAVWFFCSS